MKIISVAALLAVLVGCGMHAHDATDTGHKASAVSDIALQEVDNSKRAATGEALATNSAATAVPQQADGESQLVLQQAAVPVLPPNRQIIRKASLTLHAKDFKSIDASLRGLVRQHGGWIAAEQQTQSDERLQNVVEIKVPVAAFDALLADMTALPVQVEERKVESEDVTNAIVDTKGRIEAKKLLRARYAELMQRAQKMEDVLQVQRQIDAITEELESAAYNLQHMQAAVAYSSIFCTYYQPLSAATNDDDQPGFFTRLGQAFARGGEAVLDLLIGFVSLWPLWLAVAFGWWAWRKVRTAKAANAAAASKAS